MNRKRFVASFLAIGLAASVVWVVVGDVTIASGQDKPIEIHRAHAGSYGPTFTKPIFILALGSDSGSHIYHRGGTAERGRSDSIHIIAINPVLKKATIVGIPRDSYVPLACGGTNKINAAMFFGGPNCIVKTVENLSGGAIHFDYYMVGSFDSLQHMIDDLGGVPVNVEPGLKAARRVLQDKNSKARGIRVGLDTLNGHDALAYSRDRHDYARGDFDRTRHQGQVLLGSLTKARQLVAADPGKTLLFLRSIFANVKTDIPLLEAFKLGLLALQIPPRSVRVTLLDGGTGTTSAGSSVLLNNPLPLLRNVADDAIID
jgi:LCP family protein required for cell wall assembly